MEVALNLKLGGGTTWSTHLHNTCFLDVLAPGKTVYELAEVGELFVGRPEDGTVGNGLVKLTH